LRTTRHDDAPAGVASAQQEAVGPVRILVLTKPVPDTESGTERLGPDLRLDRTVAPGVVNGNDEYALEAALQLVEAHGGEVAILSMAPPNATDTMRKALAMGALRGILVTDPALAGADMPTTIRILAAAAAQEEFDLLLTGLDTSDGQGGAVAAGVAVRLNLPLLSTAATIEPDPEAGRVRVRRLSAKGYDVIEAPMPAVVSCTQALGAPRYPSLRGIMAARSREIATRTAADLGVEVPPDGTWATRVVDAEKPPARAAGRVVTGPPADAAGEIAELLADRRLI
jgi:electron transfer flavoprotein beta subunit